MVVAGGLALAIPAERVEEFLKRGSRPALGVTLRPVKYAPLRQSRLQGSAVRHASIEDDGVGLLVLAIERGSPAEYVSLAIGDVLLAANGRRFESVDDLADAIDGSAGTVLRLRFARGGSPNEREVAVAMPGLRREAA